MPDPGNSIIQIPALTQGALPKLDQDFVLVKGSTAGFEHRVDQNGFAVDLGNQDRCDIFQRGNFVGGIVFDGCSASEASVAGAVTARRIFQRIMNFAADVDDQVSDPAALVEMLQGEILGWIRLQASFFKDDPKDYNTQIQDTSIFTAVGFIANQHAGVIFRCGDGYYSVNGTVHELDQLERGKPAYLGFAAYDPPPPIPTEKLMFEIVHRFTPSETESLVVATDGCARLLEGKALISPHPMPGKPPLERIDCVQDLIGDLPTEAVLKGRLQRLNRLHLVYTEVDKPDGGKGLSPTRHPGAFSDDATLVGMLRRPITETKGEE